MALSTSRNFALSRAACHSALPGVTLDLDLRPVGLYLKLDSALALKVNHGVHERAPSGSLDGSA